MPVDDRRDERMIRLREIVADALRRDRVRLPAHGAGRALFQTFFRQFFASESVASDMQLR